MAINECDARVVTVRESSIEFKFRDNVYSVPIDSYDLPRPGDNVTVTVCTGGERLVKAQEIDLIHDMLRDAGYKPNTDRVHPVKSMVEQAVHRARLASGVEADPIL